MIQLINSNQQLEDPSLEDVHKKHLIPHKEIKQDIGRSPDYRDMFLMRIFFELRKTISLVTNWS